MQVGTKIATIFSECPYWWVLFCLTCFLDIDLAGRETGRNRELSIRTWRFRKLIFDEKKRKVSFMLIGNPVSNLPWRIPDWIYSINAIHCIDFWFMR